MDFSAFVVDSLMGKQIVLGTQTLGWICGCGAKAADGQHELLVTENRFVPTAEVSCWISKIQRAARLVHLSSAKSFHLHTDWGKCKITPPPTVVYLLSYTLYSKVGGQRRNCELSPRKTMTLFYMWKYWNVFWWYREKNQTKCTHNMTSQLYVCFLG